MMPDWLLEAILGVLMFVFWWKWANEHASRLEISKQFADYVAEADQRFLRVREGRTNAVHALPYSEGELAAGRMQDGSPL